MQSLTSSCNFCQVIYMLGTTQPIALKTMNPALRSRLLYSSDCIGFLPHKCRIHQLWIVSRLLALRRQWNGQVSKAGEVLVIIRQHHFVGNQSTLWISSKKPGRSFSLTACARSGDVTATTLAFSPFTHSRTSAKSLHGIRATVCAFNGCQSQRPSACYSLIGNQLYSSQRQTPARPI